MLRGLLEAGVVPDLICGTSIGALNGALIAADPTVTGARRLISVWDRLAADDVLGGSLIGRVVEVVRSGTSLHSNAPLRQQLQNSLPVKRFEELAVRFECVAASIERAQ